MKSAASKNILICLLLLGGMAHAEATSASTLSAQVVAPSENPSIPVATNSATRDLNIEEKQIYKFSFFSLASGRTADISRGGTSIGALNYIGFSRKTESNDQWGFRYVFYYDSAGYKFNPSKQKEDYVGHQTEIGDPYLTYAKDSLAQFSDWNLSYAARVYLPFSKFSQATKLVTQIRTEFNLEYPLIQYSKFNFITKTDYFVQTQKPILMERLHEETMELTRRRRSKAQSSGTVKTMLRSMLTYRASFL